MSNHPTERRIIAIVGATGASSMASSTVLMGVGLGSEMDLGFRIVGFALGALGTFLTAGIAYYKAAMTS